MYLKVSYCEFKKEEEESSSCLGKQTHSYLNKGTDKEEILLKMGIKYFISLTMSCIQESGMVTSFLILLSTALVLTLCFCILINSSLDHEQPQISEMRAKV